MPRRRRPTSALFALPLALGLGACAGPEAPDAAVCRDVVHRLCKEPRCAAVDERLGALPDCEAELLSRTGCGDDAFAFSSPDRATFLSCRATLVTQSGLDPEAAPACEDVDAAFEQCPALVAFMGGQ